MDLFVVNRYVGESEQVPEISNEQKKLNKILKNANKRKKARLKKSESSRKTKYLKTGNVSEETIVKDPNVVEPDVYVNNSSNISNKQKDLSEKTNISTNEISQSFKILGTDTFSEKIKVKRVLPDWLLNPVTLSGTLEKSNLVKISDVNAIDKDLQEKLREQGIEYFFPVQSTVIPFLLELAMKKKVGVFPQDICVSSPTGSGKTLAYVIPILQALKYTPLHAIQALVILPTQSLAVQICETFKLYSEGSGIEIGLITGSTNHEQEQTHLIMQSSFWSSHISKVHILVCTPGKLVEHIKCTKGFDLKMIEYLIIDEADRVLDNVQDSWLYHLENHLYSDQPSKIFCNVHNMHKRHRIQKLLFSATLSQDPEKLEKMNLFQPILFTSVVNKDNSDDENKTSMDPTHFIGKYTMPSELTEKYIISSLEIKPLVLYKYIRDEKLTKVLVFTNTVESVHRLRLLLKALAPELKVQEMSSKLNLKKKQKLIKIFASGIIDILVCTDSMARGIDLPNINAVFSYSAPKFIKTYIHRVGRTARAGAKGIAVTLVEPQQKDKFLNMLKEANKANIEQIELNLEETELLTDKYKDALQTLKKQLETEEQNTLLLVKKEKGLIKRKFHRKYEKTSNINTVQEKDSDKTQ